MYLDLKHGLKDLSEMLQEPNLPISQISTVLYG